MPFGGRSPLETLALPGVILAYKYRQYRQRRCEAANRRVTERELSALHYKIDKLLNKLEDSEPEPPTSQDDECVICIHARATMETSPCGHRVVCRRCFVKTIQSAVQARMLPLRCVICRTRINRLTSGSGSWLQGSNSSYSMGSGKSWGVSGSVSSYSMDQSTSLYSMSSGSASLMSGVSNCSSASAMSSVSSMSGKSAGSNQPSSSASIRSASAASCTSSASSAGSCSRGRTHHKSNCSCSNNGCLGAIPRKTSTASNASSSSSSATAAYGGTLKNVTNINYNLMYSNTNDNSSSRSSNTSNNNNTYASGSDPPYSNSTLVRTRLPTIKESPVHITGNHKNRFSATYTGPSINDNDHLDKSGKSESIEMVSMLTDADKLNNNKLRAKSPLSSSASRSPAAMKHSSLTATTSLSKSASVGEIRKGKTTSTGNAHSRSSSASANASTDLFNNNHNRVKATAAAAGLKATTTPGRANTTNSISQAKEDAKTKADNKKNELAEKKKKEKARQKAEKEAKKEEKRIAMEEERLAKMLAKEEKKRLKREAKEMLLATTTTTSAVKK